jgi:cbb3-type cytochrome oxidase subunit 3
MPITNLMFEDREMEVHAADAWWLFVVTGASWLVIALLVFQAV